MLVRSFLGLQPDVPRKRLRVAPNLPADWGQLGIDRLMIAGHRIRLTANHRSVQSINVPDGWRVD
jgi:hypothetical protein